MINRNSKKNRQKPFAGYIFSIAIAVSFLATVYWSVIASDRYVSDAHVIIQRTDLAGSQSMDFSSLLSGGANSDREDQLLLRDHLLSVDMLKKLDTALNLRAHYSDSEHDPLSRMWFQDYSIEEFHRYYLSRVSVEYDEYAGVLVIKSEGYDAKTAHAITTMLVQEGERFMNKMAHGLALDQVAFLENQVIETNERVIKASQALLNYQNKKGLVSPIATTENIANIIANLEAHRTELETQRSTDQAYLVPDHPNIIQINQQIAAVENQIKQEQAKLVSTKGKTLNREVETFQRLDMELNFVQDVYKTALVALERGRIEATRTIKKVSVIQAPSEPEYPMEPRRFYNTLVFMLFTMLLAGVAHLLVAIVRDHKD